MPDGALIVRDSIGFIDYAKSVRLQAKIYQENKSVLCIEFQRAHINLPFVMPVMEDGACFWDEMGYLAKWRAEFLGNPVPVNEFKEIADVFLLGSGNNYYHWMMDMLPRLDILAQCPALAKSTLLLHREGNAELTVWQKDAIALCQRTLSLPSLRLAKVSDIWVTARNAVVPVPVRQKAVEFWSKCAAKVLAQGGEGSQPQPKRLFVMRNAAYRAALNQDEIAAALEGYGFVAVDPGGLSISEQIRLFHGADWVIGCHGAALTNLLFCRPGTRFLEIWAGQKQTFFTDLAQRKQLVHSDLEGASVPGTNAYSGDRDFTIPQDAVLEYVRSILAQ